MHARYLPRAHRFTYRLFLGAFDLDELPELDRRLALFSVDAGNLFSLRLRDYCPTFDPLHQPSDERGPVAPPAPARSADDMAFDVAGPLALKRRVLAYCAAQGAAVPSDARVLLVTLPRIAGYAFNPVSFYFVTAADGAPLVALAEVTNTFREMKLFFLGPEHCAAEGEPRTADPAPSAPARAPRAVWRRRQPKHFYVSPFSDVDAAFDFTLRLPDEKLLVRIDDYEQEQRTLVSTLTGEAGPLTDSQLAWAFCRSPLVALKVIAGIHFEAWRLWRKKLPWFAKSARSGDQRDLRHPHTSLAQRGSSVSPRPAYVTHARPPAADPVASCD
jgi:uncharacterized protein